VAIAAIALVSGAPAPATHAWRPARSLAAAAKLSPPVIHESFTPPGPCTGQPNARSTAEERSCAELDILRTDGQIDRAARSVFSHLQDDAARRRLIAAQRAWFAYRQADCSSRSDLFEGGTAASVIAAQCAAVRNRTRLRDLRAFDKELHP
jgi:uncharacterized protein YecT (DUF1311 family)